MRALQQSLFTFLAVALLSISQVACTSTRLPPYEATYTTKLRGIKIKGVRKFEPIGENSYRISWSARALWMRLDEWSEFEIIDRKVRPISYHYTRKGLGTDRPIHVYFDWEKMQVNGAKGDKKYSFALQPGVLDKLSYQVQMQLDLIANPARRALEYTVASHSSLREYRFDFAASETIDTRLGQRDTLVFQREKSDSLIKLWIAPAQNYLPVRIEQIEDGDSNVVVIRSWDSQPLAAAQRLSSRGPQNTTGGVAVELEDDAFESDF